MDSVQFRFAETFQNVRSDGGSACVGYRLPGVDFVLDIPTGRKQSKHLMRQLNLSLPVPHVFGVETGEHWEEEPVDSTAIPGLPVTFRTILAACHHFAMLNIHFSSPPSLGNWDHKLDAELPARSTSSPDKNVTKVLAEEDCSTSPTQKTETLRLKEDILRDYDTSVRPVLHHSSQTVVYVSMFLRSINFEPYISSIGIHCWMIWEWTDEHLQWNPSDYGGLDNLHVDSYEIWVPEVSEFDSNTVWDVELKMPSGRCELESTGKVSCVPSTVYFTLCNPDLTYWPYDQVNCSLRLGAWMQYGEEINITTTQENVDLLDYKGNREWNLLSATVRMHLEDYGNNNTFPWIQYSFLLQRQSSLYVATLGVSALMFAVLVLTTFWLRHDGASRINLSCVSLFCHYLHLQYLGWLLENNGDTCPLVVLFFRDSMLLSGLSMVVAITLRGVTSTSAAPPLWTAQTISWMLRYRTGQLLLRLKLSAEGAGSDRTGGTEESEPIGNLPADDTHGWALIAILVDRVCFLVFTLVYLFLFARCLV
ncbi:neuronal acetylcholine receptor subunit beta-3 isoform X2 [Cryptotermes secundus]|uniref:neuronal acetylcholine receptor subunit beta-3 isoform X2 n=1 Tax=Cryptotermes secundus TaxID=105785 RepID=UPI000CD7C1FC|nr:neuronal acetylcholine receptor subunit beta-3 isoform X2 [Cryptotermes secundus]